jgi:SAM-dependent methyltransferase
MSDRENTNLTAREFFENLWTRGDPWKLETSRFETEKYERQLRLLADRRYPRSLELGCGAGAFTRLLTRVSDHVVGIDISPAAIERARGAGKTTNGLKFHVGNIVDYDLRSGSPWDLVVMSETIYYLGWLYSFFDVAWLASEIFAATRVGGRFLMANTCGGVGGHLMRPALIRTYHDLFLNTGYHIEAEEMFKGSKDDVEIDVLIDVFTKR